jgi:hypothetical protein
MNVSQCICIYGCIFTRVCVDREEGKAWENDGGTYKNVNCVHTCIKQYTCECNSFRLYYL